MSLPTTDRRRYRPQLANADSATLRRVIAEFRAREELGKRKYGTTVDREDLSAADWLQHAKEEAMDLVLYLDRLLQEEKSKCKIVK